ncbi:MAG: hypothetical protein ACI9DF_000182 [Verrucomicrobiales bacterium]
MKVDVSLKVGFVRAVFALWKAKFYAMPGCLGLADQALDGEEVCRSYGNERQIDEYEKR